MRRRLQASLAALLMFAGVPPAEEYWDVRLSQASADYHYHHLCSARCSNSMAMLEQPDHGLNSGLTT